MAWVNVNFRKKYRLLLPLTKLFLTNSLLIIMSNYSNFIQSAFFLSVIDERKGKEIGKKIDLQKVYSFCPKFQSLFFQSASV